ncbi:type VI secretion system protein TssA [Aquincola sp. S2]|uniref:Type VI secretion system protein TssA n=1 Tax=Pseudaquabacterium terrae TaxID=2732868 RepID=A0ABX2ECU1_9BURK|nr:type VI secretion system protein TssA [Aquabacterium terrae]NRF66468.1 type VI secretion system protein TssA [Aquabacterium terrae]
MLDIESLAAPLAEDAPSGSDLEYDPVFLALEQVGAGKPEQQYGDHIVAAEGPDWRAVQEHARNLAGRTRDLRVAVWLTRCEARLSGLHGALQGLQLVQRLLAAQWDTVHPQLDATDHDDPTMRMNALAPLVAVDAALDDLRAAALAGDRGGLTLRDLELGLGKDEPRSGESAPSETGVRQALAAALQQQPALGDAIAAGTQAMRDAAKLLDDKVGTAAPEFRPLHKLLQALDDAARAALGTGSSMADGDAAPAADSGAGGGGGRAAISAPGTIANREDAARMLERVCDWFDRHEPSHPAPLLIRRAQRLMSKSFIEIIRDLAPDGLSQIERLAGSENEN